MEPRVNPEEPEESTVDFDYEVEQDPLDSELAMRTATYFGQGIIREEAFHLVGVPLAQSDAWDELWDALEKEDVEKILSGSRYLAEDKFFVNRSLFRLKPPCEPEVWVDGKWKSSKFLMEALESHKPSFTPINPEYALDSYPEAFEDGAVLPELNSEDSMALDPRLTNGVGIAVQEFLELENQRLRDQQARILDIVSGRTKADGNLYFEGLILFRLRPSLKTEVLSQGVWQNHPALLTELREGKLPETFDRETAADKFPEAF